MGERALTPMPLRLAVIAVLLTAVATPLAAETRALAITARAEPPGPLPPGAVIDAQLLDVSRADAPSSVVASRRLAVASLPMSLELPYDLEKIDGRMSYVVAARVLSGDKVLLRTTTAYPVLTRGAAESVEVVLERTATAASGPSPRQRISGVPWAVTEIGGRTLIAEDPPTLALLDDGTFALFGGCNRFRGKAELSDGRIVFPSTLAGTRRACPPNRAKLEQDMLAALQSTVAYLRNGQQLSFMNEAGAVTARLRERPE